MQWITAMLWLVLVLPGCDAPDSESNFSVPPAAAPATFILVRHAEKGDGEDPDLTPAGTERANRLAEMLSQSELNAVYTTDTRRTRQTAQPAAEGHGLETTVYDPADLRAVATRLTEQHAGETVLVVGHSNTTAEMANYLSGGNTAPQISESDFGNVLVVTVAEGQPSRILQLRY